MPIYSWPHLGAVCSNYQILWSLLAVSLWNDLPVRASSTIRSFLEESRYLIFSPQCMCCLDP